MLPFFKISEEMKNQLRETSNSIFNDRLILDINSKVAMLHRELEEYDFDSLANSQLETETQHGLCLSPIEAANCMLDTKRTVMFVRGLRDAIKESQKRNPDQRVSVLYAGCGPFATLALPMTTMFKPEEIGFTLIDIHEESLTYASKLINELGVREYFDELVCTDAIKYKPKKQYDVLVTETMGKALLHEPHLAITENLRRTLHEKGILVPEKIALGIELKSVAKRRGANIPLGDFFTLEKDSKPTSPPGNIEGTVDVNPESIERDIYSICITTRIKVFGTHVLNSDESMITTKEELDTLFKKKDGTLIHIKYKAGGNRDSVRIKTCLI